MCFPGLSVTTATHGITSTALASRSQLMNMTGSALSALQISRDIKFV